MSGRGKGARGLGAGGARRHRKILRDNIEGVTNPAVRRIARRGGVKRTSKTMYGETRGILKVFLENVIRDTVTYTEHAKRKTVNPLDVVAALRRQGRTLYGFGDNRIISNSSEKAAAKPAPKAKKAAAPIQRNLGSVTAFQAAARGFLVRKKAKTEKAVTGLQAAARGFIERKKVAATAAKTKKAVTGLQAAARGFLVRKKAKTVKAVTGLQAAARGFLVRKQGIASVPSASSSSSSAISLPSRSGSSVALSSGKSSSSSGSSGGGVSAAAKRGIARHLNAEIPARGLQNTGNTCFAAAIMQLLASSNRFVAALNTIKNPRCELTACLKEFFFTLQNTDENDIVDPEDFYEQLSGFIPGLQCNPVEGDMQDAQEFLIPLFLALKEEWQLFVPNGEQLFRRLFETEIVDVISCSKCKNVYRAGNNYLTLFTMYPSGERRPSIQELWEFMHRKDETITDRMCNICNRIGGVTIYRATTHAPEILIFYLSRARFTKKGTTVLDHMSTTNVDLGTFTTVFPHSTPDAPAAVTASAREGCRAGAAATFDFRSAVISKPNHYVNVRRLVNDKVVMLDDSVVINIPAKKQEVVANKAMLVLFDVQEASKGRLAPCPQVYV